MIKFNFLANEWVGPVIGIVIVVVVLLIIIGIIAWAIKTFNKLVKARNRVKTQWAQIEVQLKKRFDLIPNLVETIKGYTKHEGEILNSFAEARKMYAEASKSNSVNDLAKADANLSKALNIMVNAVKEQYPELKADAQYNKMMDELRSLEDSIAHQRQFYNDCVNSLNNLIEMFPSSIIASMKHFEKAEYYDAPDAQVADAPKVSF